MSDSTALILHHYKESPYAEKVRTLLGYKQLAWRSVITQRIAPKPDLVTLTGGYRKVPVLQVGADVFCDTRLIVAELARRAPQPLIDAQPGHWSEVVGHWVDVNLFGRVVEFTFGQNVDHLPDALLADRAALRGAPLEREALKKAVPLAEQTLAKQLAWIEIGLSGVHAFVNGGHPGHGDFTLYSTLWFARVGRFDFTRFPAISAWMERMKGFGHGTPTEMSAEDSLTVAAAAQPAPLHYESHSPDAAGVALGQQVSVAPELLGHGTSVTGDLVGINAERLAVRLVSERCGVVHVHFPRTGYRVRAIA